VYLSSPHLGEWEQRYVAQAFETNWVAPLGPNVDGFERELCEHVGCKHAAAVSSGTAALHLALILAGVGAGDEVMVSSLTFVASVNPIVYQGARPVFIDSEAGSWNVDPGLVVEALEERARRGALPKALMLVHLYGQSADVDPILQACERHGVALIEDAAEALGATYKGRSPGTFGRMGVFSFNGNKIITTSGGGMLVSDDEALIQHARKLATQARDPAPHYEHTELGFNYRMSNICAGIGRGQLKVLEDRVAARRRVFERYERGLGGVPGLSFAKEQPWGRHTRWLTCLTVDPEAFGVDREAIRLRLDADNIEARPVWKPMHMQPLFAGCERIGGEVAERLFERGLCLPSGSNMEDADQDRVIEHILALHKA
jgi:pyridoxal phosphate-dependent aminotransferase EpsN